MQLERILQQHGFGTRKACRSLVRQGRVTVNQQSCDDPFIDFDVNGLNFTVDGENWPYREFATVILNKPAGYECSRKPKHHPSVLDLLPAPLRLRDVQPIGRLDEDTTGLLVLTDDGQLNHRLSSPRRKVPKVYRAETRHPIDDEQLVALMAGVVLHDDPEPVRADKAERIESQLLRLTLTAGKYHQVKRMVSAVGNRVDALHREAVGGLHLPANLAPGEWCWLELADLQLLEGQA